VASRVLSPVLVDNAMFGPIRDRQKKWDLMIY
jgi:hypothetical protein